MGERAFPPVGWRARDRPRRGCGRHDRRVDGFASSRAGDRHSESSGTARPWQQTWNVPRRPKSHVSHAARRRRCAPNRDRARDVPYAIACRFDAHGRRNGHLTRVPMSIANGTRFGPYEIVGWLGAGGMGEVYRARDLRLGRLVAIKLIPERLAGDATRLDRFRQEARAAGQLIHPNITAVYDSGVHDDVPYIVSELLEGESLRSRLDAGPLPI